jgi:hypothetical protein
VGFVVDVTAGGKMFLWIFQFSTLSVIRQIKCHHITFQYSRRCLLFVVDSVVKWNISIFCLKCSAMHHKQPRRVSFSYIIHFWFKILLFGLQDFYFVVQWKNQVTFKGYLFISCAFSSLSPFYLLLSLSQFVFFIPLIFSLTHRISL